MSELQDFLSLIKEESNKLKVKTTTEKELSVSPLTFKQQKKLITTGYDGVVGAMVFIKNLNEIILENSGNDKLKIYDRIPIAIAFRKEFKSNIVEYDENQIDLNLLDFKPFKTSKVNTVDGAGFSVDLKIPTLVEENQILSLCIEELKRSSTEDIGKNLSTILSYELPKFIESFKFGENEVKMSNLGLSEKTKIMDNLPASITNKITDYILNVRKYDEDLLTFGDITLEIDSNFFE